MGGKVIDSLLQASSTLTDIVGEKTFAVVIPQGVVAPYVLYYMEDDEKNNTKKTASPTDFQRFKVVYFSNKYHQLLDMVEAGRTALDVQSGTINGVNVNSVTVESGEQDDFDAEAFENGQILYVRETNVRVSINRS
jgi:hypothetical protein